MFLRRHWPGNIGKKKTLKTLRPGFEPSTSRLQAPLHRCSQPVIIIIIIIIIIITIIPDTTTIIIISETITYNKAKYLF
jgi:hypothetical protein